MKYASLRLISLAAVAVALPLAGAQAYETYGSYNKHAGNKPVVTKTAKDYDDVYTPRRPQPKPQWSSHDRDGDDRGSYRERHDDRRWSQRDDDDYRPWHRHHHRRWWHSYWN